MKPTDLRSARLGHWQSLSYNLFNGEEISGGPTPRRLQAPLLQDKRHVFPEVAGYPIGAGNDGTASRLRDSTSRFHCTLEILRTSEARQRNLANDGLVTHRKSTVIGFGNTGPRLSSIGVRENFTESHYAQTRRAQFSEKAAAPNAADVAMVKALGERHAVAQPVAPHGR